MPGLLFEKTRDDTVKNNLFLTVVVTAFNEENNVENCIKLLSEFLKNNVANYEIIFVNDGSTDGTQEKLAAASGVCCLKVINLEKNHGTGGAIKKALLVANGDWYCWFPSDLEILPDELSLPISHCQDCDLVITHFTNGYLVREKNRTLLSLAFVFFMNTFFGKNLKYYNGISLIRTSLIKGLELKSNRFFFHAELLLRVLSKTKNFVEVPIKLTPRYSGKSKAVKPKVFVDVITCSLRCFWELRIKNENPYY